MKRHLRHLPALLGVLLLFGAIYVVQREFHSLKLADVRAALAAIPRQALMLAAGATVISYGVLTFYDRLGTIYAGHKVRYRRVAFASFCAYALSHNLGFAAVSGAAVRYRLYSHWGLTPVQIAKVVGFCSLTFGLGGLVLGGWILFFEPQSIPFFSGVLPRWAFPAIGSAMWLLVAAYVAVSRMAGHVRFRGHEFDLPGWRMAIVQVSLASLDVAVTAAIFYTLLPATHGLTYLRFLACYLASYSAGLLANLPGGIGVFDTAILLGLDSYLPAPVVLGAILVFRLYYYIIPLFLAGTMFAGNEILLRGGALLKVGVLSRGAQSLARLSEPDFAVGAATGAVAMCGALLLSLGVLDDRPDFSWIDPDFADVAAGAGQFVPSLIGAALMVLAIGLSQRVTLAWGATISLLLAAAVYVAAQGDQLWISAVLVLSAILVAPFRDAFYRHARILSGPMQADVMVPLTALAVCVVALAAFEPRVRMMSENSWWEIVLSRDLPNGLRVMMALAVLLAAAAIWRLLRPSHVTWLPWASEGRARYAALGASWGAGLPLAADGMVMGEAGRSGIPFRRMGQVMLGLGDPAGAPSDRISAIWRLRDLAVQEGLDPAVWRAGPGLLKIYGDLGLTALPLGPDGQLLPESQDVAPFSCQYLCCVAERDLGTLAPLLAMLAERSLDHAAE